ERQAAPWYWSTGRGRQVESGRSRGRRRVGGLPVRRGNLRLVEPLRRDRRRTRLARYLPGRDLTGFGRGLMSADLPGQPEGVGDVLPGRLETGRPESGRHQLDHPELTSPSELNTEPSSSSRSPGSWPAPLTSR